MTHYNLSPLRGGQAGKNDWDRVSRLGKRGRTHKRFPGKAGLLSAFTGDVLKRRSSIQAEAAREEINSEPGSWAWGKPVWLVETGKKRLMRSCVGGERSR